MDAGVSIVIFLASGILIGWIIRLIYGRYRLSSVEQQALRVKEKAVLNAENEKKIILLQAQEQIAKEKSRNDRDYRERRTEIQKLEKRVIQKEDNLEKKLAEIEKKQSQLGQKNKDLEDKKTKLAEKESLLIQELERVSGFSHEEAKNMIIDKMVNEATHDARTVIQKIEQEAQFNADKKSREILVTTMQRIASEVSTEITGTSVPLPSEEMKGRIIGREGRNIRTLETLTGVDIIIDDTPEAVVISCFDPIRKVIAKTALERLVVDGRIHPARIEEVVYKVTKEIQQIIFEQGEQVVYDLKINNLNPELVKALGRLYFRTSYGQNVLMHSKEVAMIASLLASEIGLDPTVAKRAALLHDLGKGIENEGEGNHAEVGAEMCRRYGESPVIVNAVGAHHNDIEPQSLEAILVQVADAISASRPGARRETLDSYIRRLEQLETIAESFEGVEKCYAIQAGREVRIIVNNEIVDDVRTRELAKEIAKRIEEEMRYPGRIKVSLVREMRVIEYAR
jgi:ribonuclease Y